MSKKMMEFDQKNFSFRKVRVKIGRILLVSVAYLLATLTLAVLVYCVFAVFWRTDVERELKREIRSCSATELPASSTRTMRYTNRSSTPTLPSLTRWLGLTSCSPAHPCRTPR